MTCQQCEYFYATEVSVGTCRRFPPAAQMHNLATYPKVETDWAICGEFKNKKQNVQNARTKQGQKR